MKKKRNNSSKFSYVSLIKTLKTTQSQKYIILCSRSESGYNY